MKTLQQIIAETVNKPRSEDEQRFIDKHVVSKQDHPVAGEDQFTSKKKKAKRVADYEEGEDEKVNESRIARFSDFLMSEENLTEATSIRVDIPYFDDEPERAKKVQRKHRVKVVDKGRDYQITGDKKNIIKFLMDKDSLEWDKDEIEDEFPELFESVQIDEAKFVPGNMKLKDGSSVKISMDEAKALAELFKTLNPANKSKMEERMMKDKKGFEEIVKFAKEAM